MADRIPLILNTSANQIQELASGDNLDITGCNIVGGTLAGVNTTATTTFSHINVSGVATVAGNLSVGGILTYEDVTNVDSVGIVTARAGLKVTGGTSYFAGAIAAAGAITGTASTATLATTATTATNITVADESSDTTCFPTFVTAATGNLPPKTGSNLAFNSSSGRLTATSFAGDGSALTGIAGGVTSDAQGNTLGGTNAGDSFSGTSAIKNTLFGYNSGTAITSGDQNTSFGYDALKTVATTESNTAVGFEALKVADGDLGTAVGKGALAKDTGDGYNAALGASAGAEITSGTNNSLFGYTAGNNLETGDYNIILGAWSRSSSTGVDRECTIGGQDASRTIQTFRVPGIGLTVTNTSNTIPSSGSQLSLTGGADFVGIVTAKGLTIGPGVLAEKFHNDTGGGIQSNYTHSVLTYGMIWYGSTNAAGSWTFNVQGDGSTTLNSLMSIGETTTMTMYSANNSTSNYMTAFKVDGSTITVKWAGGSAPSAATGSGTDVYSMTIMKTANATFTVFGNFTNFA
tara:strand:- start:7459 stop:9018 length:1560 start_codon:yes stop_codon:yes gene_type:complete